MQAKYWVLGLTLATAPAWAGVVLHMATKDLASGQQHEMQNFYAQDGMLRIDELDDSGKLARIMLIRDGALYQIRPAQHSYQKIDKAAFGTEMQGMNERMQAMLAKLPPDQRAMAQARMQQMQQQSGSMLEFTDAGHGEQAGQYSCHVWNETLNNHPLAELCVVPPGSLAGGGELEASLKQAQEIAKSVFSAAPQMAKNAANLASFARVNGFPVLTRHYSDGKVDREDRVTSVERKSLSADEFQVPKGYTEQPLAPQK